MEMSLRWYVPLTFLRIPKLKSGALTAPYVSSTNGIAYANAHRLLSDGERRLSNQPRSVEDAVKLKEKKTKVRRLDAALNSTPPVMKTSSQYLLDAGLSIPSWDRSASMRVVYIVTLRQSASAKALPPHI